MTSCDDDSRGHVRVAPPLSRLLRALGVQRDVFSCPTCAIVLPHCGDAWSYSWDDGKLNFINPPFSLMNRVVEKLTLTTRFVFLAPYWSTAQWFKKLRELSQLPVFLPPYSTELGRPRMWNLCLFHSKIV
jgi:hypothetical protein